MNTTVPTPDDARHTALLPQVLHLRFTGSGAEYFRIWIVNLALTLVTLGLYYPWAKVRRLKYFYNHTLLAEHGFDFHGAPRSMLRGMLLVGLLFFLYSFASEFAPLAGLIATFAVTALWPFLWRMALRFRLANTSWRGLRFAFEGDVKGALVAAGVPTALLLVPLAVASFWFLRDVDPESPQAQAALVRQGRITMAIFLPWLLVLPWFVWYAERYRRGGFRYAQIATSLTASAGDVYRLALKLLGMFIAALALLLPIFLATVFFSKFDKEDGTDISGFLESSRFALIIGGVMLGYLVMIVVVRAYAVARMQNLFWSKTRAHRLTIDSALRFRSVLGLMLRNWLLIVLTLGLYWPYAAVAMWRMRLEAISLSLTLPVDELVNTLPVAGTDSAGEMAADLADFDLGW